MARASLKIASTTEAPPKRTKEREALAVVRAKLDDALAEEKEIDGALVALRSRFRAEDAAAKARADLAEAKTAVAIAHARAEAQKFQDEFDAATRTKAELEERRADLKMSLLLIDARFEGALARVVASDPALVTLLHEFDAAKVRFMELHAVLECLGCEMFPEDRRGAFFVQGMRVTLFNLLGRGSKSRSPLAAQWKSALAHLASDPDAILPAVPTSDSPMAGAA